MNFDKYYEDFISDLTGLIKIPSVLTEYNRDAEYPFGEDIHRSLEYVLELGKRDGFKTVNVNNHACYIEYGEGKEMLGVLCHLDVVPVGKESEWKYHPFSATIEDGKMYSRGTGDDKGPSIAAYYALKMIKDNNIPIKKRIRLIFGLDEESGSRCMKEYIENEEIPTVSFAPDAEFPLIYAEKGIASFAFKGKCESNNLLSFESGVKLNVVPDEATAVVNVDLTNEFNEFIKSNNLDGFVEGNKYTLIGATAHGSLPHLGVNAASMLLEFLNKHINNEFVKFACDYFTLDHYGKKLGIDCYDEEMADLTINPAIFKYDGNEFVIASNIRYPKNFDYEANMKKLYALADKLSLEFNELGNSPHLYVSKESVLVKTLLAAYQKYTNDYVTQPLSMGGGTYARSVPNAVAFGPMFPGDEELAHQRDEYVELDKLVKSVYIYYEAMKNLCD